MIVDISHVADKTFWGALETSKAPIFASHSSCRAISPVPRNMADEMIVAMAKKGGVVQINFDCGYLNPEAAITEIARMQKLRRMLEDMRKKYVNDPEASGKCSVKCVRRFPPIQRSVQRLRVSSNTSIT
jgi:membrane dipeptidase